MKIVAAALLLCTLSGMAHADKSSKHLSMVCVFKSKAIANINADLDEFQKATGLFLTAPERTALIEEQLNAIPPQFHLIETRADCPKGMNIFHPSNDPNVKGSFEHNN